MPRKKGPNINKLEKIKKVLKKFPRGLWIRELSRKTNLDKSTVSRYITLYMKEELEIENLGIIKIVRLK